MKTKPSIRKTAKKMTPQEDTIAFLRFTLGLVEGREISPGVARLLRFPLECALGAVEDVMRKELGRKPANSSPEAKA